MYLSNYLSLCLHQNLNVHLFSSFFFPLFFPCLLFFFPAVFPIFLFFLIYLSIPIYLINYLPVFSCLLPPPFLPPSLLHYTYTKSTRYIHYLLCRLVRVVKYRIKSWTPTAFCFHSTAPPCTTSATTNVGLVIEGKYRCGGNGWAAASVQGGEGKWERSGYPLTRGGAGVKTGGQRNEVVSCT